MLGTCLVSGKICLTSDMWSSAISDGYMSITAHYVDEDWKLQNKLLIFCHVPPPHTGQEKMFEFLKEWGIEKKIFPVTLDNAKYNDKAITLLESHFSFEGSSICGNEFLHVRCGAHILNLIVKSGLAIIEKAIKNIRESVKYLKGSEVRLKKFANYAKQLSMATNKKLTRDISMRWNSTYVMLERALLYKEAFSRLDMLDNDYEFCPSDYEWSQVEKIASFLKPFYDMTVLFSKRKYPTSNLYFPNVWKIQLLLERAAHDEDDSISMMAFEMRMKFLKYWECYSIVLSFAIILDPRYKLQFVDYCFNAFDPATKEERVEDVKNKLTELFDEYSIINSASSSQASQTYTSSGVHLCTDLVDGFDSYKSKYANTESKSELELYLKERLVDRKSHPNLDVLNYWKDNTIRYPNLSLMARDVLSVPITTVANESAFSYGGRIIGKYCTSLLPENVEATVCCRDWLSDNVVLVASDNMNEDVTFVTHEEEEDALGVDITKYIGESEVSSNID